MLRGKALLNYTNLFSPNGYKKKWPNNVSSLSTNKATLVLRLEKIDDTRNHLLEEIKHKIQKVFGANSYVCKS